ncbi:MAG: hypothetical protein OXU45_10100 [Candidatus Melainabacteria bacterium]|nr:hypothetical protein [Candidatus Melainabacteria bacterium]
MRSLHDLAYVVPATVAIGYFIGAWLEKTRDGNYVAFSILIATACGFLIAIVRIKRYIDSTNKSASKEESKKETESK